MTAPKVSIIILNWNGWRDTLECLESVFRNSYPNYEVVVLDNGSKDESLTMIRDYCEGNVVVDSWLFGRSNHCRRIELLEYSRDSAQEGGKLALEERFSVLESNRKLKMISCDTNFGFTGGNNAAIEYLMKTSFPDYILLLNNDTVVHPESLDELVRACEANPRIGFAGPKVYYNDFGGRRNVINFSGGRILFWKGQSKHIGANELDKGQYDEMKYVDYVEGSCLLARSEMIKKIGVLDADFFSYWEDVDWCQRGRENGYLIAYVPGAMIWHKIYGSTTAPSAIFYTTRNMFYFLRRHCGVVSLLLFAFYFFGFAFFVKSSVYLLWRRNVFEFGSFSSGIFHGLIGR